MLFVANKSLFALGPNAYCIVCIAYCRSPATCLTMVHWNTTRQRAGSGTLSSAGSSGLGINSYGSMGPASGPTGGRVDKHLVSMCWLPDKQFVPLLMQIVGSNILKVQHKPAFEQQGSLSCISPPPEAEKVQVICFILLISR